MKNLMNSIVSLGLLLVTYISPISVSANEPSSGEADFLNNPKYSRRPPAASSVSDDYLLHNIRINYPGYFQHQGEKSYKDHPRSEFPYIVTLKWYPTTNNTAPTYGHGVAFGPDIIFTNNHVIPEEDGKVYVFDHESLPYDGVVVKRFPDTDSAFVYVPKGNFPPAKFKVCDEETFPKKTYSLSIPLDDESSVRSVALTDPRILTREKLINMFPDDACDWLKYVPPTKTVEVFYPKNTSAPGRGKPGISASPIQEGDYVVGFTCGIIDYDEIGDIPESLFVKPTKTILKQFEELLNQQI